MSDSEANMIKGERSELVIPLNKGRIRDIVLVSLPALLVFTTTYFFLGSENKKLKEELITEKTTKVYFEEQFKENERRVASYTNDALAEYVSSYKEHNTAQLRFNRNETMKAVDRLNISAGKLAALGVSGVSFLNSSICYQRFNGGYISDKTLKADKSDMEESINQVTGKAKRMIDWRMKLSSLGPNDPAPEMPK